jgi:hypothetical protein
MEIAEFVVEVYVWTVKLYRWITGTGNSADSHDNDKANREVVAALKKQLHDGWRKPRQTTEREARDKPLIPVIRAGSVNQCCSRFPVER